MGVRDWPCERHCAEAPAERCVYRGRSIDTKPSGNTMTHATPSTAVVGAIGGIARTQAR